MPRRHLCLIVLALLGALLARPWRAVSAQAPAPVGLVLQGPDGATQTFCIYPEGRDPTGYDVLLQTGMPVQPSISAQGVAICQIGEVGCPPQDCFCQCQGAACSYWAYFYLQGGDWQTATTGAGGRLVQPGDVEGWRWGGGEPPPVIAFEEICAPGRPVIGAPDGAPLAAGDGLLSGAQIGLAAGAGIAAVVGLAWALGRRRRR